MAYTIKQAAKLSALPPDTLRYYDKLGIVIPKRHKNGYRYYDKNDISILQYVSLMKYAQFSLEEIKLVAHLFNNNSSIIFKQSTKKIVTTKINALQELVVNYQKIIELLSSVQDLVEENNPQCENRQQILTLIDTFNTQIVRN